jgi:hypothetical protein
MPFALAVVGESADESADAEEMIADDTTLELLGSIGMMRSAKPLEALK